MVAPADNEATKTGLYGTFMAAVKCRRDGSRVRHIALVHFNPKTGTYEEGFDIGTAEEVKNGEVFKSAEPGRWPDWSTRDWLHDLRVQARTNLSKGRRS